ncbi:transposase [Candidatus Nitrospira salsa]
MCERWLPLVHKCISSAKDWINETYHGVRGNHQGRYVGEFTYRFNRCHDVPRLFHQALVACT